MLLEPIFGEVPVVRNADGIPPPPRLCRLCAMWTEALRTRINSSSLTFLSCPAFAVPHTVFKIMLKCARQIRRISLWSSHHLPRVRKAFRQQHKSRVCENLRRGENILSAHCMLNDMSSTTCAQSMVLFSRHQYTAMMRHQRLRR